MELLLLMMMMGGRQGKLTQRPFTLWFLRARPSSIPRHHLRPPLLHSRPLLFRRLYSSLLPFLESSYLFSLLGARFAYEA